MPRRTKRRTQPRVEYVHGIRVVYHVDKNKLPPSVLENLFVTINNILLFNLPVRRIDVDSVAGLFVRGRKRGKFVNLGRGYMAILSKR